MTSPPTPSVAIQNLAGAARFTRLAALGLAASPEIVLRLEAIQAELDSIRATVRAQVNAAKR